MKLRAPAYPLITVDPYFSLWSMADRLNADVTRHWTGKPQPFTATAVVDGIKYLWMGVASDVKDMEQVSVNYNALSTVYLFSCNEVELRAAFTTPLLPQEIDLLSTPVSYLEIQVKSLDGKHHKVDVKLEVTEEICLNIKGEMLVEAMNVDLGRIPCCRIGSVAQPVLRDKGDDQRINWGYFYLAASKGNVEALMPTNTADARLTASISLTTDSENNALFLFAYDDICSLEYFGVPLKAYWKRDRSSIEDKLKKALTEYMEVKDKCDAFSQKLYSDAKASGGERYAELLSLAWRQVIAAHKLVLDDNDDILFISKECLSDGEAATVDVTYPSLPMFLLYNPELAKGMLRPIFRYAASGSWTNEFAPHDVGVYPIIDGQDYGYGQGKPENQMPIEECGNMVIMSAAICISQKDASFAKEYLPYLKRWTDYLVSFGDDPENQLCTDDFAGHLAHNCNLSLKAIMAIASYGTIMGMCGEHEDKAAYIGKAKDMAADWLKRASNGDGSYRLAFDKPDTFSMKYNIVWDKVFGTDIFPQDCITSELESYKKKMNKYGLPIDNRADYTKSDWLLWIATLTESCEEFMKFIDALWTAYNDSESRVPMTDWFDTKTAKQSGFQNRSVQGGLFMKLLDSSGLCRSI